MSLNFRSFSALAIGLLIVTGCSSNRMLPSIGEPPGSATNEARDAHGHLKTTTFKILAQADLRRLPVFHTSRRRARPNKLTFANIELDATLFPSDQAAYTITQKQLIKAPGKGTISTPISFSNVPVANNVWVVAQVYGVAADGSKISLGTLMGLFNVTASGFSKTPTLNAASTQVAQVFLALLFYGVASTNVLEKTPTLAATIASAIKSSKLTPDPTTGLFTTPQLQTLYDALYPGLVGTLDITPAVAGSVVLAVDYTNAAELNLALARGQTQASLFLPDTFILPTETEPVVGYCGLGVSAQSVPYKSTLVPTQVNGCFIGDLTGDELVIPYAYTGHLIVSATNTVYTGIGTAPLSGSSFTGWLSHVEGVIAGKTPVTGTASTMQQTVTVNDPEGFAFGAALPFVQVYPQFGNQPLSQAGWGSPLFYNGVAAVIMPGT